MLADTLAFIRKHRLYEALLVPFPPVCLFAFLYLGVMLYLHWEDLYLRHPILIAPHLTAMVSALGLGVYLFTFEHVGKWYYAMLPAYLFQKVHVKDATVIERIEVRESMERGLLPGHYLRVKIDWTKDCQTTYPRNYKERTGYVQVSRRLFRSYASSLYVFCQYSRHEDDETSVKLRLAR